MAVYTAWGREGRVIKLTRGVDPPEDSEDGLELMYTIYADSWGEAWEILIGITGEMSFGGE